MIGCSLNFPISSMNCSVNAPGIAAAPIATVGFRSSQISSRFVMCLCSLANTALCGVIPPLGRFYAQPIDTINRSSKTLCSQRNSHSRLSWCFTIISLFKTDKQQQKITVRHSRRQTQAEADICTTLRGLLPSNVNHPHLIVGLFLGQTDIQTKTQKVRQTGRWTYHSEQSFAVYHVNLAASLFPGHSFFHHCHHQQIANAY